MRERAHRRWPGTWRLAAGFILLLAMPCAAAAAERRPADLLTDQLLTLMHAQLDGAGEPEPDELERARVLLELALELGEEEAELWHLRVELARHMDDADAERDALGRYVRLRPGDAAAQLALIRARLATMRTLDAQLERIEAILDSPRARAFSAPLRSRLATDAARIAQELGQRDVQAHWLERAVRLDAANPGAAAKTYRAALERGGVSRIAAAAVHYAAAAPASAGARVELADMLLSQALYREATEQYAMARQLSRDPLPADVFADWALALAALGEDDAALGVLAQLAPEDADEAARDRTGMVVELELLRLAILTTAPGRDDAAQRSYARLERRLRDRIDALAQAEGADEARAARAARAGADLAWVQLLFDRDVDEAAAFVDELEELVDDEDVEVSISAARLARLRAWQALRTDEPEAARERFAALLESDPFAALGLAALAEETDAQAELLTGAVHRAAGSLAGLLAGRHLRAAGEAPRATDLGRSVQGLMARHPSHLWRPALNVSPWIEFELRMPERRVDYLDPLPVTLVLRNASRMPLALAEGRGAPTRAVLSTTPSIDGERTGRPAPVVVDVARRLTLAPGESLAVEARLDHGQLGAMLAQLPHRQVRFDLTAILGPRRGADGRLAAEPAGGFAFERRIAVRGMPWHRGTQADEATLERLIEALKGEEDEENKLAQWRAVAGLTRLFEDLPDALDDEATRQRIADAVNDATRRFDPLARAWVARFLPRDEQERAPFQGAIERLRASNEPIVRILYLASHVRRSDDAVLVASLEHRDPTIRAFAEALRTGLERAEQGDGAGDD